MTSKQCCEADEITFFDFETKDEITFDFGVFWIEDGLCLINTTDIANFDLPSFDANKTQTTQSCSILTFDEVEGEFEVMYFQLNHN